MGEERKNRQKGTTLIELVIGIIVLGILASIAWPSWVSVKSEAGAVAAERTKESLKAKWLAARNDHDRGAADEPTLGRLVGYKAAVPPAPATIPMLLDYSYHLEPDWWGHMYAIDLNNTGSEGWNTVKTVPWSGQITCMGSNNMFLETAWAPGSPSAGWNSYNWLVGYSAMKISGTPDSGATVGAPVPKCRAVFSYVFNIWVTPVTSDTTTTMQGLGSPWVYWNQGNGWYAFYKNAPTTSNGNVITTNASRGLGISVSGVIPDTPAYRWRMTCKGGESTYGVPYTISGYSVGSQNGKTVSDWYTIPGFKNLTQLTAAGTGVVATYSVDGIPPSVGAAVCQRVGPATAGNPEWLGDPKIATDFSGWCLGAGTTKKLPTFKDTAKSVPTTAYGDAIKSIGAEVDDPAHCPAS